jgi:aryl-alcohol dehydrogenase-like predicted oxidoreductase
MQFGWTADRATSFSLLDAAFEAGINFIDSADIYSKWVQGNPGGVAEQIVGEWLMRSPGRRDQLVLATKVRGAMDAEPNAGGLSRKHIFSAVEASLRRLNSSYIDLYQLHWPDDTTSIDETLEALTRLVERGRVRYIGCSNFPAWRVVEGLLISEMKSCARFISVQPHYNLIHRDEYERELEVVCDKYGLGVMPYSPLARGFLTGKYRAEAQSSHEKGDTSERIKRYLADPEKQAVVETLMHISAKIGSTAAQVSLAWLLEKATITSPIIGPRTLEQLHDNLGALEVDLSEQAIEQLDAVSAWAA